MAADPAEFFGLPPGRVAVVLIDFQNDFCSPDVAAGGPVTNTRNAAAAVRANRFAAAAAQLGAHVVYTLQVLDPQRLTPRQRRWERPDGLCTAGSCPQHLVPTAGPILDAWRCAGPLRRQGWSGA